MTIKKGQKVLYYKSKSDWLNVKLIEDQSGKPMEDGNEGWVARSYLVMLDK